jgi:hypothetical protein
MLFRSSIKMNVIDNRFFNEIVGYHEMTKEGSMKGVCPVYRQQVEAIESCVDTLDIHYLTQGGESKLCPGSGTRTTLSGCNQSASGISST